MSGAGPLPLAEARAIVRGATAFTRDGDGGGPDGDTLWAALLSLADADELVAAASRLDWQFHPRGFDNVELHDRYGDGIVPWLATRLDDDGVLHNLPWCVVPCLLRCTSAAAFELVWRVKAIEGRTPWGGAGDADLLTAWRARHPDVAARELARIADREPRAGAHLFAMGRAPLTPPTAAAILAVLDACAGGLLPTRVRLAPSPERIVLRAIAARAGDDWGLALEWIEGTRPTGLHAARVAGVAYGSRVQGPVAGARQTSRPVPDLAADDVEVRLGPPALALAALGLPPDARVVAVVPAVAAAAVPSESPVFRALAAALVDR